MRIFTNFILFIFIIFINIFRIIIFIFIFNIILFINFFYYIFLRFIIINFSFTFFFTINISPSNANILWKSVHPGPTCTSLYSLPLPFHLFPFKYSPWKSFPFSLPLHLPPFLHSPSNTNLPSSSYSFTFPFNWSPLYSPSISNLPFL